MNLSLLQDNEYYFFFLLDVITSINQHTSKQVN